MTPEDLIRIREVEDLKYRYLRCVDLKLWDELAGLLTEDVEASYGGGAYTLQGRDRVVGFLRRVMGSTSILTSHKCHHPEIDFPEPDLAHGVWALDDVVIQQEFGVTIRGAAFYDDLYRRIDGRWLIARTGYRRVYEELYPRSSVQGLSVTADFWATEGRSTLPVDTDS